MLHAQFPFPVPHYLRTKLDLDLEAKQREQCDEAATRESAALTKEIGRFNEILTAALERVKEAKDEQEDQKPKSGKEEKQVGEGRAGVSRARAVLWYILSSPHSPPLSNLLFYWSGVFQPTTAEDTRKLAAIYLGGTSLSPARKAALLGVKQG